MRNVGIAKNMRLQPSLLILSVAFLHHPVARADDFIHMASRRVWRVHQCALDNGAYKVRLCYASQDCAEKYDPKKFSCQKSFSCGENYLKSSDFSKRRDSGIVVRKFGEGALLTVTPKDILPYLEKDPGVFANPLKRTLSVVIYPQSKGDKQNSEAIAQMEKDGVPHDSILFSLSPKGAVYELISPSGPSPATDVANANLIPALRDLIAYQMGQCPTADGL
jgi:hypothetical protein